MSKNTYLNKIKLKKSNTQERKKRKCVRYNRSTNPKGPLPFKMLPYSVFSYVIGQISNPQMSSLSDHFALNTTLRNFCFLAHTEDTHWNRTAHTAHLAFAISLSLFSLFTENTTAACTSWRRTKLGVARSGFTLTSRHSLATFRYCTHPHHQRFAFTLFFPFSQQQCASELLYVFHSVQHTGLGSGAFCCSTYVTMRHVAKSTAQKSGTI